MRSEELEPQPLLYGIWLDVFALVIGLAGEVAPSALAGRFPTLISAARFRGLQAPDLQV